MHDPATVQPSPPAKAPAAEPAYPAACTTIRRQPAIGATNDDAPVPQDRNPGSVQNPDSAPIAQGSEVPMSSPFPAQRLPRAASFLQLKCQQCASSSIIRRQPAPPRQRHLPIDLSSPEAFLQPSDAELATLRDHVLEPLGRADIHEFLSRIKGVGDSESNWLLNDPEFWKKIKPTIRGFALWVVFTELYFKAGKSPLQQKLYAAMAAHNISDAMNAIALITMEEPYVTETYWQILGEAVTGAFTGNPQLPEIVSLTRFHNDPTRQARKISFLAREIHYESNAAATTQRNPARSMHLKAIPGNPHMVVYVTANEFRVLVRIRFMDGVRRNDPYDFASLGQSGMLDKWKSAIEQIWNNKFELHNTAGNKLRFTVVPEFLDSKDTGGEDKKIYILTDRSQTCRNETVPGRSDADCWFADQQTDPRTIAHEFGHLLGADDEYNLPGSAAEVRAALPNALISPEELALTTMEGIGGRPLPQTPGGYDTIKSLMHDQKQWTNVEERHIQLLVHRFNADLHDRRLEYTVQKI